MKKRIKKTFRPGERVMLKLDRAPDKFANKIGIVQDPPYSFGERERISRHRKPWLNVKWEDDTPTTWMWPGSYWKRVPVRKRSLMPDTRSYLDIMSSLDI